MFLPIRPKPHRDEILSSWLIRTAMANGLEPNSLMIAILNEYRFWNKDIDRNISDKHIYLISKALSTKQEVVKNLTLEPLIQDILSQPKISNEKMWLFVIPTGQRGAHRTKGIHFCPKCLSSNAPYLKKQWKLAWNVACPIHKIKLISKCNKCGFVFSPHLIKYDKPKIFICPNCGYDLRKIDTEHIGDEIISFQEILNTSCFEHNVNTSFPLIQHNYYDLFTTLRIFISFFQYICKHKKYSPVFEKINMTNRHTFKSTKGTPFEAMNIDDRVYLLSLINKFFNLGLLEIIELISLLKISAKTLYQISSISSPTINYMLKFLYMGKTRTSKEITTNNIRTNNKQEVDRLMQEIERFL